LYNELYPVVLMNPINPIFYLKYLKGDFITLYNYIDRLTFRAHCPTSKHWFAFKRFLSR